MRRYLTTLLCLVVAGLLLLPAVCTAKDRAVASRDGSELTSRAASVYGQPWRGSYLRKVPSTLRRTTARNVWVRYRGQWSSWADGYDWSAFSAPDLVPMTTIFGNITRVVTWEEHGPIVREDPDHPEEVIAMVYGRAKARLTATYGRKIIKARFRLISLTREQEPNFPVSPIYRQTLTRVR